jgi:hypothetical protein
VGPSTRLGISLRSDRSFISIGPIEFAFMFEILRSVGVFVLASILALPSYGANDPFAGTWKLSVAKSKMQPPAPESDTVRIEVDDKNVRIEQEGIDDKGAPFKLTVQGGFDDSFYGIVGSAHADAVSFRRPSSRHILAEVRKSGVAVAWVDAEVSGNNLRVNLSFVDTGGKEVKSLAILQRE